MSQPREGYPSVEVSVDRVSGKAQLPGRQTAAARRSWDSHPAISLSKMRVESNAHMLHQHRVGLFGPLNCGQQTWAEVGHDGIVDCHARLYGESLNSAHSELIGQPIEAVPLEIKTATLRCPDGTW